MKLLPFFFVITFFAVIHAQEFKPLEVDEDPATLLNEVPSRAAKVPPQEVAEEEELEKKPGKSISGVVRLIRSSPQTEVFFKDLKESYFIPRDSQHNKIFEACQKSSKTGAPVALQVDPVSRRVLLLNTDDQSSSSSKSGLGPASNSESQKGNK